MVQPLDRVLGGLATIPSRSGSPVKGRPHPIDVVFALDLDLDVVDGTGDLLLGRSFLRSCSGLLSRT
jgi:hypothetical protein